MADGNCGIVPCSSKTADVDDLVRIAVTVVAVVGDCDGRIAVVPILLASSNQNFYKCSIGILFGPAKNDLIWLILFFN
jgi:hypothetical protein